MDTSRLSFLQNVLQYTTANTGIRDVNEKPVPRELSPDVRERLFIYLLKII